MTPHAFADLEFEGECLSFSAMILSRLLSFELFKEAHGIRTRVETSVICHDRWTDVADALAALPVPAEFLSFVGRVRIGSAPDASCGILAVGRGKTIAEARAGCAAASRSMWIAVTTTLDFADFAWLGDRGCLQRLVDRVVGGRAMEMLRRRKEIELAPENWPRRPVGFRRSDDPLVEAGVSPDPSGHPRVRHLFPWMPSDDPWWRLLEALFVEEGDPLLVAHATGMRQAPRGAVEDAREQLARCSSLLDPGAFAEVSRAALQRVAILEGPLLAARIFVVGASEPGPALIAAVESSVDDPTVRIDGVGTEALFRGGTLLRPCRGQDALEAFEDPPLELLFGAREAAAFLRTPMPSHDDLPGLPMKRARTARLSGQSGTDCPLGSNVHGGERIDVALDLSMRTRHTYVVGQTGTGKSTLLLHMILHDIQHDRGVCVLDPHGTLVQDILERYPQRRADDLMVLDVEDIERPIGFNILHIDMDDPLRYCTTRDLLIDELYAFLDHTYDLVKTGGPIFETYFRGMLRLLLGDGPRRAPLIPNLSLFRSAFTNARLRSRLLELSDSSDPILDDFLKEIGEAGGDASLKNISPYVTSKLNRFTFDSVLRSVFCQDRTIDFDAIVRERKVLLCHTARGRVGDYPAGLLAGQVLSGLRRAVLAQQGTSKDHPFCLYADEFQLFATQRFGELLAEARKFGLAITIAHQFVAQLDSRILSAVLGNVGTVISLRLGAEDANKLEPVMLPIFSARDLLSIPNFRACMRSFGALGYTPFSLELHGPPDHRSPEHAESLRERSRQKYGFMREDVEREFRETHSAYMEA